MPKDAVLPPEALDGTPSSEPAGQKETVDFSGSRRLCKQVKPGSRQLLGREELGRAEASPGTLRRKDDRDAQAVTL